MTQGSHGLIDWLLQRISAIYLGLYIPYLLIALLLTPPSSYVAWRGWMMEPMQSIGGSLFFTALLVHAWVGIRDVIMDYVRPVGLRLSVLVLLGLMIIAQGFWVVRVLLGLES